MLRGWTPPSNEREAQLRENGRLRMRKCTQKQKAFRHASVLAQFDGTKHRMEYLLTIISYSTGKTGKESVTSLAIEGHGPIVDRVRYGLDILTKEQRQFVNEETVKDVMPSNLPEVTVSEQEQSQQLQMAQLNTFDVENFQGNVSFYIFLALLFLPFLIDL